MIFNCFIIVSIYCLFGLTNTSLVFSKKMNFNFWQNVLHNFWNRFQYCNHWIRSRYDHSLELENWRQYQKINRKSNLVLIWMPFIEWCNLCRLKTLSYFKQYVFSTRTCQKKVVTVTVHIFTNNSVTVFCNVNANIYYNL